MELIVGRDCRMAFPRGFINRTDVRIEKSSLFGGRFDCRNYSAMKAIAKLVISPRDLSRSERSDG